MIRANQHRAALDVAVFEAFGDGVDVVEVVASGPRLDDDHPELFRTPAGDPIDPTQFETVRHRTRLAGVNMRGQGSMCDALHEARRAEDRPPLSSL